LEALRPGFKVALRGDCPVSLENRVNPPDIPSMRRDFPRGTGLENSHHG
jgi:hypothetical protein